MKKISKMAILLAIVSVALLFACCGKGGDSPLPDLNLPKLTISEATDVTKTSAKVSVQITDITSSVTESGVYLNGTKIKADGNSASFTMTFNNLTPNTNYTVKGYAIVAEGTAYSSQIPFTTKAVLPKVTDYDGNQYDQVVIGTQTWLVQDLKVTHYRNGDVIPNVTATATWSNLTTAAMCYQNNDQNTKTGLYNWYAAADSRGITPAGWHVPTEAEWATLLNYLGGYGTTAGYKMQETGTTHWPAPNDLATNSSEFTAIPNGYRLSAGDFRSETEAHWMMFDSSGSRQYFFRILRYSASNDNQSTKNSGAPIRCIKN